MFEGDALQLMLYLQVVNILIKDVSNIILFSRGFLTFECRAKVSAISFNESWWNVWRRKVFTTVKVSCKIKEKEFNVWKPMLKTLKCKRQFMNKSQKNHRHLENTGIQFSQSWNIFQLSKLLFHNIFHFIFLPLTSRK